MNDVIVIDFTGVASYHEVHSLLDRTLDLPSYYGRNLDALHDCLTEIGSSKEPVRVRLVGMDKAGDNMSRYMTGVRKVFEDSERENPGLIIEG
ncbi:MAG: barstar family protein [Clostridiales bacterium]|nr:barstar family protein [Clostridiales bacterium]